MPLGGSHVIHPHWSAHHRPTATSTMTSECVITRRSPSGTTDDDGKWTPAAPSDIYSGTCRVQVLTTNERVLVVGETQNTRRRYQVSIEWDAAEISIDDLVCITKAKDPRLAGKQLRVADIAYGSEQWERDLVCMEMEN
jgi:hypothetical protein